MSSKSTDRAVRKNRPETEFERRHFIYLTGAAKASASRGRTGR